MVIKAIRNRIGQVKRALLSSAAAVTLLACTGYGCAAGLAGSGAGYDYMSRDRTNQLDPRMRAGAGAMAGLMFALSGLKGGQEMQNRQWAREDEREAVVREEPDEIDLAVMKFREEYELNPRSAIERHKKRVIPLMTRRGYSAEHASDEAAVYVKIVEDEYKARTAKH